MIGIRKPYDRLSFRGVTLSRRTAAAFAYAERKAGLAGRVMLAQGSYSTGVAASAGTHDGGGALDCSVRNLTPDERKRLVVALKSAGFAAWHRPAMAGVWGEHIHCVDIGASDVAAGAAAQVRAYDAHRDGLRGNAWDPTYRPDPKVAFSYRLGRPVKR